tara:strand:+ start:1264 stop:1575 length:312 start_codon:yes stop_codon:yes gene_type:complete
MKIIVKKHQIIGTQQWIFTAWEPMTTEHSTITHIDGMAHGRVGSKSPELCTAEYPYCTEKRMDALVELFKAEWGRAYKEIYKQVPELREQPIVENRGQIEVWA